MHPHELDWCASLCSHLMCKSYLLFLECNCHARVPLSPNLEFLMKEFDLLVLEKKRHSCVLIHAFDLVLMFGTCGLVFLLLV